MNSVTEKSIQETLVSVLKSKKLKIATAESLTGGMISKMITEVSGASAVLECGICSYSNRIKHEILGVSSETLEKYTEYSAQTACEMAEGVRKLSGADIGISTTGIAGPGGGSEEKPVGLVYIGISSKLGTFSEKLLLGNGAEKERELIREQTARKALETALAAAVKLSL
ncbi:MAG: CinA family protein [Clostridia bacterium]|nr:CinA family protein [Clostridia bacterium]